VRHKPCRGGGRLCHGWPVAERQQLSQYGVTWQFDRPVKSGQFVTGDWWVVGPVTVVSITPAAGPAPQDDKAEIKLDRWGNTSMRDDNRMRNGSMVILECGPGHGYDSRSAGYSPELVIKAPYTLEVNRSLISTISNKALRVPNFCRKMRRLFSRAWRRSRPRTPSDRPMRVRTSRSTGPAT